MKKKEKLKCGSLPTADIVGAVGKMQICWRKTFHFFHVCLKDTQMYLKDTHIYLKEIQIYLKDTQMQIYT